MPTRAPTICPTPGCPNRQPCPAHPPNRWANGAHGRTMPTSWTATRRRILTRDPWCTISAAGCTRYATEVDHLVRGGGDHDANLRGVCAPCHQRKTNTEASLARAARA